MSYYTIDFQLTRSLLNTGGSFENPTPLAGGHPPFVVSDEHGNVINHNGETAMIPRNSTVRIICTPSTAGADFHLAPVRFVCGDWTHDGVTVHGNTALMDDNVNKPIGGLEFSDRHPTGWGFAYASGTSDWVNDANNQFGIYPGFQDGSTASLDGQFSSPLTLRPYISFQCSDLTGSLNFGIEIAWTNDGSNINYNWWDPTLRIT